MRSMFGNRYKPDTVILRPFRAWVSWLCHFIGLHPMLRYTALSGLHLYSPERAKYVSEAVCRPEIYLQFFVYNPTIVLHLIFIFVLSY